MAGVMSAACFIGSVARQAFSQRLLSGFARLHLLFQAACARAIAIFRAGVRIAVARAASFARGLRRSRRWRWRRCRGGHSAPAFAGRGGRSGCASQPGRWRARGARLAKRRRWMSGGCRGGA